jgi:hypothetical protein
MSSHAAASALQVFLNKNFLFQNIQYGPDPHLVFENGAKFYGLIVSDLPYLSKTNLERLEK